MHHINRKLVAKVLTLVLLILLLPVINADNINITNANTTNEKYLRVVNKKRTPTQERFASFKVLYEPRPYINEIDVPLRTSFYFVIEPDDKSDTIITDSIKVELEPEGGSAYAIMDGTYYPEGYLGTCINVDNNVHVSIDSPAALMPNTTYTIRVRASSENGATIPQQYGQWQFTTASVPKTNSLNFDLDLKSQPVTFNGSINGIVIPAFTTATWAQPMFELMSEARKDYPRSWTVLRDFYLTGFENLDAMKAALQPQPNIVRELETRRITKIEERDNGLLLFVEDFFGHEQYGIPSNRPLSEDYKPGYIIQIGDKNKAVNTKIISVDDSNKTVLVEPYVEEIGDWQLEYDTSPPTKPRPNYPGLFVTGGTYLRSFNPVGTPVYYWDRLDHQFDALVQNGIQPMPNFVDAPGDIALDGIPGTTAKDLRVMRQVAYDITEHIIKRYGEDTVNWYWSIFNEINIPQNCWRIRDNIELQRFYDYTIDGIFKAFEDNGLDSNLVKIGGIEMGGLNAENLSPLECILVHASPTAEADYALNENAVYADPELDGKRSRRIQELGDKYGGKGSPLDFVSVHTYHTSANAAKVVTAAKDLALEIDCEYFEKLEVCNHEAAPLWRDFYDQTGSELYLSNGYFSSWAADFVTRLVDKASEDPRYGHVGNMLITLWPWHPKNFSPQNDIVREFKVKNENELLPMQIFHSVSLLSMLGPEYWVFPAQDIERHNVSGLASRSDDDLYVMFYSHNIKDTQSRSDHELEITLNLKGYEGKHFSVVEYRLDREHNSYYELARKYKDVNNFSLDQFEEIKELSILRPTTITEYNLDMVEENIKINVELAGNGVSFLKIMPGKYEEPIEDPTEEPSEDPTEEPTDEPIEDPTTTQTPEPSDEPTPEPTEEPSSQPLPEPSKKPTKPIDEPSATPTETMNLQPTEKPDETGTSPKTGDVNIALVIILMIIPAAAISYIFLRRKKFI